MNKQISTWYRIIQGRGQMVTLSVQTLSLRGRIVNIFSFTDHYCLCLSYSVLLLKVQSSHGHHPNEWTWLRSNEALFTKAGLQFASPGRHPPLPPDPAPQRWVLFGAPGSHRSVYFMEFRHMDSIIPNVVLYLAFLLFPMHR